MEYCFLYVKKINAENCVYYIKNVINNKYYVGSTTNFRKRIKEHYNLLESGKHHSIKLQNSWNKNGVDNFVFKIVENDININDIIINEQYYIDYYDSVNNGYNILPNAGTSLENKWFEEDKKRYSKLKKSLNIGTPVIQYDMDGKKINEYPTMKIASKLNSIGSPSNIGLCCRKERNHVGGFVWEYKDRKKQKKYGFHLFIKKMKCPHCGGKNTKKSGFAHWNDKKKQIYKCNNCLKSFNESTKTPYAWNVKVERNKDIVRLFLEDEKTIQNISDNFNISKITVIRVLKKHNVYDKP